MYRIILDDVSGNKIIVSHDVIFKELALTCTVPPREGENNELLLQPIEETVPIQNPIENPQARPDLQDRLQIPV